MPTLDYVLPTPQQIETMNKFRAEMGELYRKIETLPKSRGVALALTKLEESAMWLNKALTNND